MHSDFNPFMELALKEAEKGLREGEVPIGAVVIGLDKEVISKAHNQPIARNDPTAHAEILALRSAGTKYGNYRLNGLTLVATIEPCLMCMGAIINARISRLVFGAFDPKSGAVGSLYNLPEDHRLNHRIEVVSGVMEQKCGKLLQDFFRLHRDKNGISGEVPKWS
jgi:tRNA(adenine34) deaminase